jgi:flagellar protein FlbD
MCRHANGLLARYRNGNGPCGPCRNCDDCAGKERRPCEERQKHRALQQGRAMIQLTRLNGTRFYLNADHIQTLESSPDTHILLTNGQQYVVREPVDVVADLALSYQARVRGGSGVVMPLPVLSGAMDAE